MTGAGDRAAGWLPAVALAALFAALAAWSWGKWTDVHIDFGNELYLAWRIHEGDVLYRDLAYRHGPLSHYVNAAWFALGGVSLRTLVVANLALLGLSAALAHRALATGFGSVAASAAVAVWFAGFAFAQYVGIANYNHVTPYHHYQTHGLLLGFAALNAFVWAAGRAHAPVAFGMAGLALGGVFLTKVELFVPLAVTAGVALVCRPPSRGETAAFGAGVALLPLGFLVGLAGEAPFATAVTGVLGNWAYLGGLWSDPFYRGGAGLDRPAAALGRIALGGLQLAVTAVALFALDRRFGGSASASRLGWALAGGVLVLGIVFGVPGRDAWVAALPGVAAGAALGFARRGGLAEPPRLARLLWSVFALGLLAKMLLATRIEHYGFALALPATLLLVALAVGTFPDWLARSGGTGRIARPITLALCGAFAATLLGESARWYAEKTLPVATGGDAILAAGPDVDRRPRVVEAVRQDLARRMGPGDTLLVLPEGVILNYWLRKENPTPYRLFLPVELRDFGEAAIQSRLEAAPPDFVALLHRSGREFGVGAFGVDPRNGRALLAWVRERYVPVARSGAVPFTGRGFGAEVLERRDRAQGAAR